ncbi:hypothetical protein JCM16303_007226 [Sporobolomyces ruberrimus]
MQRYSSSLRPGRGRDDILRSRVIQVASFYKRMAFIFQQLGASTDEIRAWQEDMDRILFPLPSCQYCKPTYSKYVIVKPWWRVTREEFLYIAEVEEMILRGRMKDRQNPLEYRTSTKEGRMVYSRGDFEPEYIFQCVRKRYYDSHPNAYWEPQRRERGRRAGVWADGREPARKEQISRRRNRNDNW